MWQKLMGVAFAFLALTSVGLTLVLLANLGASLWAAQGGQLIAIVLAGAVITAVLLRGRLRRRRQGSAPTPLGPHPGISMSAIPIAGGAGLLFAIGYVVMFWFGAPGYRPLVLGVAGAGGLLGLVLIRRARSRPQRDDTSILHLGLEAEPPTPADRPQSGRREDARFTGAHWRARLAPGRAASSSV